MTEEELEETPDERLQRLIIKYEDSKYDDIDGISYHNIYCIECEQVLGIDYNYGSKEYPPTFICSNSNCSNYSGGYLMKDNNRLEVILAKLRSLGAKERVSRLETKEILEDWH